MIGRQSAAMDRALKLIDKGMTLKDAADKAGVDIRALRRAMRRHGYEPRRPDTVPLPVRKKGKT